MVLHINLLPKSDPKKNRKKGKVKWEEVRGQPFLSRGFYIKHPF